MSMQELVIDIDTDGKTSAMHFDEFDLKFLGKKKITRASEIFYNDSTEKWDITLPGDSKPVSEVVQGFDGYDKARNFEVEWLQACRKGRCDPHSPVGISTAVQLRKG